MATPLLEELMCEGNLIEEIPRRRPCPYRTTRRPPKGWDYLSVFRAPPGCITLVATMSHTDDESMYTMSEREWSSERDEQLHTFYRRCAR